MDASPCRPAACSWAATTGIRCNITGKLVGTAKFKVIDAATVATATASSVGTTTRETNKKVANSEVTTMDDAVVTDAMSQFKSLSRVDRKAKLKEVKKKYKARIIYKNNLMILLMFDLSVL